MSVVKRAIYHQLVRRSKMLIQQILVQVKHV
jgi:hypothetical protein